MDRINVTKTYLPPYGEFEPYLKQIWDSAYLTNQGPLLQQFEAAAKDYLQVANFHFVSNGTIALQLALQGLNITEGEVITTPFSYVATVSSILWQRCTPVFVDIEPETFCIDPQKIAAAITNKTVAIMPVHVFGNPCDVEAIQSIATEHNLPIIYDAAHAFGVRYKGKSLLNYGDIATASFHATKLFHTIEGGAIIVRDKAVSDKIELIKRFGHNGDEHFILGINGKSSEFQAAMGLANLPHLPENIAQRKHLYDLYTEQLGGHFRTPIVHDRAGYNYAYYPLLFANEASLLKTIAILESRQIFLRRYFYPSLNTLPYVTGAAVCPIAEDIAVRIVCLPLYVGLTDEQVLYICDEIKGSNGI